MSGARHARLGRDRARGPERPAQPEQSGQAQAGAHSALSLISRLKTGEDDGTRTRRVAGDDTAVSSAETKTCDGCGPNAEERLTVLLTVLRREAPELVRVVEVWHRLPAVIRRAVLALVAEAGSAPE